MIILILWNQNTLICKRSSFLYIQPCGHSSAHSFNNEGVVHSASLKMLLKLCKIQELKILWTGPSARSSQHTLTLCLDILIVPSILPLYLIQLTTSWWSALFLSPGCPEHMTADLMIWWSQNWSSICYLGCSGAMCAYAHPCVWTWYRHTYIRQQSPSNTIE